MRRDDKGNPLYRHVDIKVILPEGRKSIHQVVHAPPRQGFHPDGIDEIVSKTIEQLDARFKYWNFRMIQRGANAFTFVYDGLRDQSA
jgi:hypothetical protein